jgi:hypothetical protein
MPSSDYQIRVLHYRVHPLLVVGRGLVFTYRSTRSPFAYSRLADNLVMQCSKTLMEIAPISTLWPLVLVIPAPIL